MSNAKNIALIPARSGSKRSPGKNVREVLGKPLIAYTILAAQKSSIFDEIIVSTDSSEYMHIASKFGVRETKLRPASLATDSSPDIEWVNHAISELITDAKKSDRIFILRPTSPLRTAGTIRSALKIFSESDWASSLRALEPVTEHPGKMWRLNENRLASPYLSQEGEQIPTHSRPTQSLETLYVQNASLEITTIDSILNTGSIAGDNVMAFEMPDFEGLDVNSEIDFKFLEFLILSGIVRLT
jgi:N-acylneuraminate cytidylyltransferase